MSFRELRNFCEMMKALGYQRLVSIENFRRPNFELVADVLFWLVYRYDPNSEISDDISTEDKRIDFLQSVAQIVLKKARIKLNTKKLYQADGHAVRELLKLCTVLYDSVNMQHQEDQGGGTNNDVHVGTKLEELKQARNLATKIVDSGAKLYTLLGKEEELKKSRERAIQFLDSISLNLESNDPHEQIERNIMQQINIIQDNISDLENMCVDLDKDQKKLKTKIERKQMDLERQDKRLKSLKKVRPAFLEEYDVLEQELKQVYEIYLERFRNLQYLESELHKYHQAEMEKKQESDRALRRMQKRLREEELRILRGEQEVDENALDDSVFDSGREDNDFSGSDDDSDDDDSDSDNGRPRGASGGRRGGGMNARITGSMDGGGDSDDDSSSGSSDESSDDDDDDSEGDEDSDDDSDDDDDDDDDAFF